MASSKTIYFFDRPFNQKSMPRTPDQYQNIRQERVAHIKKVALELFSTKGYFSTSISDIAKAAGISKGLLYNYFESKEDLIKTIILSGSGELLAFVDPDHDGVLTTQEIRYLVEDIFRWIDKDIPFWQLYFSVITQPPVLKMLEKEIMQLVSPFFKILTVYFESKGYTNPATETRFFIAVLDGVFMNYVFDQKSFPIEDIKQRILNIYHLNE